MAGDWIKMRTDLRTNPKVVRISSALKADRFRTVGGLHAVWCLFDAHSVDGTLEGYSVETLDDLIGWPGFSQAMVDVEWLETDGNSLSTPRFDEHNGKSAKRRALESERKRAERIVPDLSALDADKKRTREEKRREEKKELISTSDTVEVPPKKSAAGSRLPEDWRPTKEDVAYCRSVRPELRVSEVAQNFYEYWSNLPDGRAARKLDWSKAWQTWVRKESAPRARAGPAGFQTANEKAKAWADELTGKTANDQLNELIDIN